MCRLAYCGEAHSCDYDWSTCCNHEGCGSKCFPSNAKVTIENGKIVPMSKLQIGDRVQTGLLPPNWCLHFKEHNISLTHRHMGLFKLTHPPTSHKFAANCRLCDQKYTHPKGTSEISAISRSESSDMIFTMAAYEKLYFES